METYVLESKSDGLNKESLLRLTKSSRVNAIRVRL
jgi:hypothetical protein